MLLHRITLPLINALFITFALIYLMFLLIDTEHVELQSIKKPGPFTWAKIPEPDPVKPIVIKPVKPIAPDHAPPVDKSEPEPNISINSDTLGTASFIPERTKGLPKIENKPLIRIFGQPGQYPNGAIQRRIEGYVVVGFSVDQTGLVFDEFVIEADPQGVFERSALRAIKKFKYQPKLVSGKAVSTAGQQYLFSYRLDSD